MKRKFSIFLMLTMFLFAFTAAPALDVGLQGHVPKYTPKVSLNVEKIAINHLFAYSMRS